MPLFILTLLALAISPVAAYAQVATDPSTTPVQWYTSALGISGATIFVLSMGKRLLGRVDGINRIPTWAYTAAIGAALTAIAAYGFGTMPTGWEGVVEGGRNAAVASGFYSWFQSGTTTLAESAAPLTSR